MAKYNYYGNEGSFRIKNNGKTEYRITYKDENGVSKRKSFTGFDEADCIEQADEFLEKIDRMLLGVNMDATLTEIVKAKYDSDLEKNYVGEQGYSRNMHTISIIEKSAIGKVPIAELTELHLNLFLGSITKYSNSVIEKIYQQVRIGFSIAHEKEIIRKNLMLSRDLRCPKSDKPDKKVRGFTEKEQQLFVETVKKHKVPDGRNDYKLQLFIELYSGMRMGEINALKPKHIDFDNKVIHVQNTVSRGKNYRNFIKEGTKTYKGVRDIPMNKLVEPLLAEAIKKRKKNPMGLIFYDHIKDGLKAARRAPQFSKR